ncbi:MAG: DUF4249 family protein [Bacteroidales bacterium]
MYIFHLEKKKDTLYRYLSVTVRFQDPAKEQNFYSLATDFPIVGGGPPIFNDWNFDGQLTPISFDMFYEPNRTVVVELQALSKDYFLYLSRRIQTPDFMDSGVSINNYYKEPPVTYSNTSNRVGMMASYVKSVVKFQLP